jgi:transcriptional regulator with XRE-family HTH domain
VAPGPKSKARPRSTEVGHFGARVRTLREQAGLSQEKLAEKVGVHASAIGHVENGTRELGIGKVWKLALALGVTPNDLFGPAPTTDED